MVVDAKAIETGTKIRGTALSKGFAKEQQDFRGSWSGYERDKMFINPGGHFPRFFDGSYVLGVDLDDDGRAAAVVDVDGDGRLDLAVLSLQGLHLFRNNAPKRTYARVRLTATKTEPYALGAVVKVTAGGVTQQNWMKLTEGFLTQIPREMHFGLAGAEKIDRIEVAWPSGTKETWTDLPAGKLIDLKEGEKAAALSNIPFWNKETAPQTVASFDLSVPVPRLDLDGGESAVAAKGRPAVINFWAPWCAPCKEELPALAALEKAYGKDVSFASISLELKDLDSVRAAAKSLGMSWPQFVANEKVVRSFFGPDKKLVLPSTFIFDGTGRMRRAFLRPVTEAEVASILDTLRRNEEYAQDYQRIGLNLLKSLKHAEAAEQFKKSLELRPDDPYTRYLYGLSQLGLRNPEGALTELRTATSLDPDFIPAAWFNMGVALLQLKRPLEAIDAAKQADRLKADDPMILAFIASCYVEAGQADRAIEPLDRLLAKNPKDITSIVQKGQICMLLRRTSDARTTFQIALQLDPKNVDATVGMAQAFYADEDAIQARSWVRKALELDPKNPAARALVQALEGH